jgi:hypothetical protein
MALGFRRQAPPPGPPKTGGGLPLAVGTGRSANPDLAGVGAPVQRPAPTVPFPVRNTPINKALTWLINALQLNDANVPRELDTSRVVPTIDIGANGWPLATYTGLAGSITHGAAQLGALHEDSFLVVPDPVNTQVIIGFTIFQNVQNDGPLICEIGIMGGTPRSTGTAGEFPFTTPTGQLFGPLVGFMLPQAPAVGFTQFYLDGITGGARYLVAPPGFGIYLSCFNQMAGQQTTAFGVVAVIPGAFGAGR